MAKKKGKKQPTKQNETTPKPIAIDIIIPCHNSHKTIDRTLGSILCQRVLPSITVTLVRDGGEHYQDIIDRYSPVMKIQEIGYDDNGGPGKARNYGITHTNGDVILFIDSDDVYASPFSVIDLCNELYEDPTVMICISDFIEEIAPGEFKRHSDDVTFVHGKIYRRSYLEKKHILFNEEQPTNEDVGFNLLALLLLDETEKVKYSHIMTHYWLCNPNSIVRSNKEVFDHSDSFRTFVKNLLYIYEQMDERGLRNSSVILDERVASMGRIANLYFEKTIGYEQYQEENLKIVKEFYKKVYEPFKPYITQEMIDEAYDRYPYKEQFQLPRAELYKFIDGLKD